jgi:hypothetical protein
MNKERLNAKKNAYISNTSDVFHKKSNATVVDGTLDAANARRCPLPFPLPVMFSLHSTRLVHVAGFELRSFCPTIRN